MPLDPLNFTLPDEPTPYQGNPLYERQAPLGLHPDNFPPVAIVGCGGVGVWVALSLALAGVRTMQLYDGDTLSAHNLNRFPLPPSSVGLSKSEALANWLTSLRPITLAQMDSMKETCINPRGYFDPAIHTLPDGGFVVCATDSLKSRKRVYEAAIRDTCCYLEVGADGEQWSLSPSPPLFSTELEDDPGYQVVPVHVGPCMMAGAAAAYYVLHSAKPSQSMLAKWDPQKGSLTGEIAIATMDEEGLNERPSLAVVDSVSLEYVDNGEEGEDYEPEEGEAVAELPEATDEGPQPEPQRDREAEV